MFPWILASNCLPQESPAAWTKEALPLGKDALFLLPAELVCGGEVSQFEWSPGGEYLIAKRRIAPKGAPLSPAPGDLGSVQIVIYSSISGRSSTPVSVNGDVDVEAMQWITAASKAVVTLRDLNDTRELRLVSVDGSSKVIASAATGTYLTLTPSPTKPQFMVRTIPEEGKGETVNLFDATSRRIAGFEVAERYTALDFGQNGSLYAAKIDRSGSRPRLAWYTVDVPTGKETEAVGLKQSPIAEPREVEHDFTATDETNLAGNHFVRLQSKSGDSVVVSGDGTSPQISPSGQAVAYVHKGVLMVRPILRKPIAVLDQLRTAAERNEVMSRAKQVGIAMQIYASDMDDALPSNGNWQDELYPYVKNRDVMAGFVFSYTGGTVKATDPTGTVLGYVPGPGGNAITYLDGHVVWTPGPFPKN